MIARTRDDLEAARAAITKQLARRDIGSSHQRAVLNGLLAAINWVNGVDDSALGVDGSILQKLIDGVNVDPNNRAQIIGPPIAAGAKVFTA